MKRDLVSIVIPVYNVEPYIERCLKSVISQSYKNIEIILIDDGSTDNSATICDQYSKIDTRIKVIHKKNGGLSSARNVGINISSGTYICFIDSDDYISEDYVDYLYSLINKYDSDISVCDCEMFFDKLKNIKQKEEIQIFDKIEMLKNVLYGKHSYISAWGKLYKKDLFEDINYPEGQIYEDVNTTYLLYEKANNVVVSNQKKYYYYIHNNSITTKSFSEKNFDILKSNDIMVNDLKKYDCLKNGINRRTVYSRISLLCKMITDNYDGVEKKEIITFIRRNGKEVLKDKRTSLVDKISIRLILHAEWLFEILWKIKNKR
jgi:glycosyltransferase involved in cell wall biosynthesis